MKDEFIASTSYKIVNKIIIHTFLKKYIRLMFLKGEIKWHYLIQQLRIITGCSEMPSYEEKFQSVEKSRWK